MFKLQADKQLFYILKTFELVFEWYFILWSIDDSLMLFYGSSLTKEWILFTNKIKENFITSEQQGLTAT
jgi:hypothetical protein